jgi:hypothetical protein
MALASCDEERRHIVGADLVEIAGNPERFRGLLARSPAAFRSLKRNTAPTAANPRTRNLTYFVVAVRNRKIRAPGSRMCRCIASALWSFATPESSAFSEHRVRCW